MVGLQAGHELNAEPHRDPVLGGVDDAFIVSKPFLIDDLGAKVRLALTKGMSDKVVPLRR